MPVAPVTRTLGFGTQTSIGFWAKVPPVGSLSQIHDKVAITLQVIAAANGPLHERSDGEPPKTRSRTPDTLRRASKRMARRRHESQLTLALSANVSQRHLSFIESGRAKPSRGMIVRLCDALDIPLRERNELLDCAGYAALYPERPLERLEIRCSRGAFAHHRPPRAASGLRRRPQMAGSHEQRGGGPHRRRLPRRGN